MSTVARPRMGGAGAGSSAIALRIVGVALGVFLVFTGLNKAAWLTDSGPLREQFDMYAASDAPGVRWYIETLARPGLPVFARLVPLAEIAAGAALIAGFWTRLVAALAFLMVANFQYASSAVFGWAFLSDATGFPVMGGLLGLAIAGGRLPWSLAKS